MINKNKTMENIESQNEMGGVEFVEHPDFLRENVERIGLKAANEYLHADKDGNVDALNEKVGEMIKAQGERLADRVAADLSNPETREKALESLRYFIKGGISHSLEQWLKKPELAKQMTESIEERNKER